MNRLATAKSPYLRQHAANPVDWYAWGGEAFAKAKAEGKAIFLSVGYATCHWCHVMAHESFEDPEVAELLNRAFVPVKVDREERPDVDQAYMAFVQATTGQGGWPMSVWLTPDLQPFYGGTYFPKSDRWGMVGFLSVLGQIEELWLRHREELVRRGEEIAGRLREALAGSRPAIVDGERAVERAFEEFARAFDPEWGGFGPKPKFPRPAALHFLLRYGASRSRRPEGERARSIVQQTLEAMARGGIRDQIGGGFHRYSVDRFWRVPHFEKMLYDQAQLASIYLERFGADGDARSEGIVREILDYLLRDLELPGGGFASGEDADSLPPEGGPAREGAFYLWRQSEISGLLDPAELALAVDLWGVQPEGNIPAASDPHQELAGRNILFEQEPIEGLAARHGLPREEMERKRKAAAAKLLRARGQRPRPAKDDKVVLGWNALAVSALARAGLLLGEERYWAAAERTVDFLLSTLFDPATGKLFRLYREGRGEVEAFAGDYAMLVQALLDLFELTQEAGWVERAVFFQDRMEALFRDPESGAYWTSGEGTSAVPFRLREEHDGAEPAPISLAATNLLRFSALLPEERWPGRLDALFRAEADQLVHGPTALPHLLAAYLDSARPPASVVVVGARSDPRARALLAAGASVLSWRRLILGIEPGRRFPFLGEKEEFYLSLPLPDGTPVAYLCQSFSCSEPISDPEILRMRLRNRS
ncbi:thioredoxin domain-containing protein [Methylacidimicrobium sp. B4]|uniref:thioredoxin domain-containing protein n=1 Tax=Methylacidimicrobium sp. B4 TaxID=2796139 RepID=UPI001A8CEBE1|nr:thioredoxin domain-containing protein [Methylacidimicrobium sp. B4]QSR83967.1 thioredoxin domain-containing protein [Methylacidimicrobium sp. B4]